MTEQPEQPESADRPDFEFATEGLKSASRQMDDILAISERLEAFERPFAQAVKDKSGNLVITYVVGSLLLLGSMLLEGVFALILRTPIVLGMVGAYFLPPYVFSRALSRADWKEMRSLEKQRLQLARNMAEGLQHLNRELCDLLGVDND